MDYESFECWLTAAVAAIAAGGWVYQKVKAAQARGPAPPPQPKVTLHLPSQLGPVRPPVSVAPSDPTKGRWLILSIASAAAAYVAVIAASSVAGVWISLKPGMPPDVGEGMGYAAGLFICVAGPVISALAGGLSAVGHALVREFQARDLPIGAHLVFGVVVGIVSTFLPAILLSSNSCTAGLPC